MRATVLSDAVFKQDRFERLRSLGDDLLFLLGAVQQDIVEIGVGSAFVLYQLIRKKLGNGNLESVSNVDQDFQTWSTCAGFEIHHRMELILPKSAL